MHSHLLSSLDDIPLGITWHTKLLLLIEMLRCAGPERRGHCAVTIYKMDQAEKGNEGGGVKE